MRPSPLWLPGPCRLGGVPTAGAGWLYLLSPVQEVLLECYGGHELASTLDRHFRFRPNTEPPPVVDPPPPQPPARRQLPDEAPPLAATGLRPAQDGAVAADHGRRHPNAAAPEPAPTEEDLEEELIAAVARRAHAASTSGGAGCGRRGRGRGRGAAAADDAIPIASAGPASEGPEQPRNHVHPNTQRERACAASEAGMRLGFASLDAVSLQTECRKRALTASRPCACPWCLAYGFPRRLAARAAPARPRRRS